MRASVLALTWTEILSDVCNEVQVPVGAVWSSGQEVEGSERGIMLRHGSITRQCAQGISSVLKPRQHSSKVRSPVDPDTSSFQERALAVAYTHTEQRADLFLSAHTILERRAAANGTGEPAIQCELKLRFVVINNDGSARATRKVQVVGVNLPANAAIRRLAHPESPSRHLHAYGSGLGGIPSSFITGRHSISRELDMCVEET